MNKDKFFISGGVSKSGTTWLYKMLQQHPEVKMPIMKEIRYFTIQDTMGKITLWQKLFSKHWAILAERNKIKNSIKYSGVLNKLRWVKYFLSPWNDSWYRSLFSKDKCSGDLTPSYAMLSEKTIQSIKKMNSNTKIIIGLRNPIDRTWSHIKMRLTHSEGKKSIREVDESLIEQWIYNPYYFESNNYSAILNKWKKYFDNEQILIYYYDELKERPQQLFNKICDFLEIKAIEIENINEVVFKGGQEELPLKYKKMIVESQAQHNIETFAKEFSNKYSLKWLDELRVKDNEA